MAVFNEIMDSALDFHGNLLAQHFEADVFSFLGGIRPEYLSSFRQQVEHLSPPQNGRAVQNLAFFLHTPGGVAEVVEKMVEILRYHYQEIWFIVPDMAMSAGTILCMSGDKIYMDYSSALGPIDPQVPNSDGQLVPALGYLDQVERLVEKSARGTLTDAEFAILQNQDLATLRRYEQAKDLSISLLKSWLVKYKFKDWDVHARRGTAVTEEEKINRAEVIATQLSDHNHWHSHGRMIGINTLRDELKLKIEDYTDVLELRELIRQYSDLLLDCCRSKQLDHLFHTLAFEEDTEQE